MTRTQMVITVLILSLATALTRFLPFLVFPSDRKRPEVIKYLGKVLPGALLAFLVVYSFKGAFDYTRAEVVASIVGSVLTVGSFLYKRQMMLSIVLGTVGYMAMIQFVF